MDFFWPEKYERSKDFDADEMFKMVQQKRDSLLENLSRVSPQMWKSPTDLLTVYAIYDVFSVKGEKWENTRVRFLEKYKSRLLYYLQNKSSLPEYRSFIRKLFNDSFDSKLKNEIRWMDMDSYFVENGGEKLVSSNGILWEEVKSWDEFRNALIKMCKELFPYAEKRFNNLLYTKNFNNTIYELFFKEKKEEFLWILSESISEYEESLNESKNRQISRLKKEISELWESKELFAMLDLIENWDWKIFLEIDTMVRALSVFDVSDFDIRWDFIQFYINDVVERFRNSSDRRDPARKIQEKQLDTPSQENNIEIWIENNVGSCEIRSRISPEDGAIIDNIVQLVNLDKKNGKALKKYLERLLVNWKNCRMSSLNKFWIFEIDEKLWSLFQNLWILVEYVVLDKEDAVENTVENTDKLDLIDGDIVEIEDLDLEASSNELGILEKDLYSIVSDQARKYNYKIFNEKRLKKQFEELCNTDDELKQILCVEMQKDSFWTPKKKQGRSYYTIEVAVTWIRFLLFKCKDWKFLIDWVYNHDDYEKRVKEVN